MKFRFFLTHGFIKKKIKELKKNKKNDSFCVFLMDFKNVLNEEIKNSILESSGISKQILVEYIQSSSLAIGYARLLIYKFLEDFLFQKVLLHF